MVLNDYLATIEPDTVIYLGCQSSERKKYKSNGSGFVFIGYAKDVPVDLYGKDTVMDVYPHVTDIPGTTILINGIAHGSYWTWHEYDPEVPLSEPPYQCGENAFENLLNAIAKVCIQDYRVSLNSAIRHARPQDDIELNDVIYVCRQTADLDFLRGSNVGDYMIQVVEDEARVLWKNPKYRNKDAIVRQMLVDKKRKELQTERVRRQAKLKYATIRGRSVNHDLE